MTRIIKIAIPIITLLFSAATWSEEKVKPDNQALTESFKAFADSVVVKIARDGVRESTGYEISDRFALYLVGLLYKDSNEIDDANEKMLISASMGFAPAEYALGYALKDKGADKEGDEFIMKAATQGFAPAQCDAAVSILLGIEKIKNEKARRSALREHDDLVSRSAKQGYAHCQFILATKPSTPSTQRRSLLLSAAKKKHANAQVLLAEMYITGKGILRDRVQGYAWFVNAAANGASLLSNQQISTLESMLTKSELEEGDRLAKEYYASPSIAEDYVWGWASQDITKIDKSKNDKSDADEAMANALSRTEHLKHWKPDDKRMKYAIDIDDKLSKDPAWNERSLEERFKEAERLTLIHFGDNQ